VSTPLAAESICLGSPALSPLCEASVVSTEVRQSARFPSLHKDTATG
jgi:hypothetical protein